jgi:hypothetical protein
MKLKDCILLSSIFVIAARAVVIQPIEQDGKKKVVFKICIDNVLLIVETALNGTVCPNYQLQCPDCPAGQMCVHPDSGGCEGAGIPICQATNCHGVVCLIKRLPW